MNVNFEPIIRGLKSDILKCEIRFIYVGFNCKICAIKGGGVGRLMANAILNFHFDYRHPSLNTFQCVFYIYNAEQVH